MDPDIDYDDEFDELMDRLKRLSTCNVADALVKLDGANGCLTDFNIYSPRLDGGKDDFVLAGSVLTVKMVDAKDTTSPRPSSHFIDDCPRGSILLIQTPPGTKSACWGGLMTAAAVKRGIIGVVIDGGCRDLKEHRDKGFPVIARHHSVLGQGGSTRVSELRCPLTIEPLGPTASRPFPPATIVESGYILLADIDGVVIIDDYMTREVIELAEKLKARDDEAESLISTDGLTVQEAFQKTRPGYRVDA